MALAQGDYLIVAEKVAETLNADTGEGGLKESGAAPVVLIEPGLRDEPRQYGIHELPAISVCATGKSERSEPNAKTIGKVFHLALLIYARSGEREQAEETIKKIAARLEQVIREQNAASAQFQGLPALVEGGEGVLVASVTESRFSAEKQKGTRMDYLVFGEVLVEIWIPVSFNL